MDAMQNLGFVSTLVLGAVLGAVTVGPCCWYAAQLYRAVSDRRAAWSTHRTLVGTISSLGLRVAGFGALALVLVVVLTAVYSGEDTRQADQHKPLPATSSSTTRR
jgi:hypothetical protein